jgi:hypothetical protein
MGSSKSVELAGHQLLAGQGLDDDIQTGQNGVGLGQEVAVAQQLVLRHIGELGEHFLVFGVSLDEAEENLRGDISVSLGLVPGFADDTAVVGAQDAFLSFIGRDGGDGSGDGGRGGCRLTKNISN